MLIAPIILATVAVVLLVYGTSTQTVTHIINDDARPASLGGSQASTGESVDTSHKTARSEPATVTTHMPKPKPDVLPHVADDTPIAGNNGNITKQQMSDAGFNLIPVAATVGTDGSTTTTLAAWSSDALPHLAS